MAGSRREDKERKRYNVFLDPDVMREIRVMAARRDGSISELVEDALRQWLARKSADPGAKSDPSK